MRARDFRKAIVALSVWACSVLPAGAQGVGAISGTVTDTSDAIMPGVAITLSSTQGTIGANQQTVTDERGAYQFLRLVPGSYIVKAELQGFRPTEQRNITVNADGTSRADLKLQIGEGGVKQRGDLLDPFKAGGDAGRHGMVDLVGGNDLLDAVQSVLTDDLTPTSEQGLVVFGGHAQVPFGGCTQQRPHAALTALRIAALWPQLWAWRSRRSCGTLACSRRISAGVESVLPSST